MVDVQPWRERLPYDPLPPLLEAGDPALEYFARRDLLDEVVPTVSYLWDLPGARRILKRQQADGAWPARGDSRHPAVHYHLVETWRQFRYLVEMYGFTRADPRAERAAEFLFSCQTPEGDIRGFLANQYATYYTGAILSLLIQAGYADDARVERGMQWLLSMRQDDGGWSVPILTRYLDWPTQYQLTSEWAKPLQPDRSQPFSHNWTGMVLRAFAAHPVYRASEAARVGADLLKSRFFQPDVYTSYQAASYWLRFDYPFWWNHLVSALDSVARIGVTGEDAQVQAALAWLAGHQQEDGGWRLNYARLAAEEKHTAKTRQTRLWVSLAICRVFKRVIG